MNSNRMNLFFVLVFRSSVVLMNTWPSAEFGHVTLSEAVLRYNTHSLINHQRYTVPP